MAVGTMRYWAAAKEAAGTPEEPYDAATLAEALRRAHERHVDSTRFGAVVANCSFVVDGDPVGLRDHAAITLTDGGTVEVLPPFAGG
ncbi:MoaD/ThiS family protein [Embleya sp. NBC_00896]|uniref:MoaD/ThiS family protein n=1 Tax=Embleya sp. NBC_00896 TaxID=2975961 RepID=UPI003866FB67|nr:MoaD/ThiS family protein [Embleya sp. NBC_00896]